MTVPEPSFRLQIECKNLADYSRRFAKRFEGEFFVQTATPPPVDTEVLVHLVFSDGVPQVSGNAKVVRAANQQAAVGVIVRFVDQHTRTTGSFSAAPAEEAFSDFDEAPPTRASAISQEMAETLKQKEAAPQERAKHGPAVIPRAKSGATAPSKPLSDSQQTRPAALTPTPPEAGPTRKLAPATPMPGPPEAGPTRKLALATPPPKAQEDSPAPEPVRTPAATPPPISVPAAEASAASRARPAGKIVLLGLLLSGGAALAVVMFLSSGRSAPSPQQDTEQVAAPDDSEKVAAAELAKDVQRVLKQAEANAASGRLTGPNSALESLLEAKGLSPADPQVEANLNSLADMFEQLATAAADAGNWGEAAAHLQAELLAAPDRTQLKARMTEIEDKVRGRSKEPAPID